MLKKILFLDNMKNMHIDDIVMLYIQGYRLEENFIPGILFKRICNNINTYYLASNPDIVSASGVKDENRSIVLVLFQNRGESGYIRIRALGDDKITENNVISCNPMSGELLYFTMLELDKPLNSTEISSYRCTLQENCDTLPPTCLEDVLSDSINIEIEQYIDTIPAPPGPLTLIPGPGTITVEWQNIPNVPVFAFNIKVLFEGREIKSGYVPENSRTITILGLVSGRNYNVEIYGISNSNISGEVAAGEVFLPVTNVGTVAFIVNGPEGAISQAIVNIDGKTIGTTDINGRLTTSDLAASEGGTPHEYLVIKEGLNNTTGTINVFPGISSTETVRMTRITPGAGSVFVRVICDSKPCEGTYVSIEGRVRGITDKEGSVLIEDLIPVIGIPFGIFKPGYFTASPIVDILENTTTRAPLAILNRSEQGLGILFFTAIDISGAPVSGAQITANGIAFPLTRIQGGNSYSDRMSIGMKYDYSIVKSGYITLTGTITQDQLVKNVIIIMHPIGSVSQNTVFGEVSLFPIDELDNPLDLVQITVDRRYISTVIYNGELIFTSLTTGIHNYRAEKEGYSTVTGEFSIDAGIHKDIRITMTKLTSS